MTDRVQDDDSLIPPGGDPSEPVRDPIVVVAQADDEERPLPTSRWAASTRTSTTRGRSAS